MLEVAAGWHAVDLPGLTPHCLSYVGGVAVVGGDMDGAGEVCALSTPTGGPGDAPLVARMPTGTGPVVAMATLGSEWLIVSADGQQASGWDEGPVRDDEVGGIWLNAPVRILGPDGVDPLAVWPSESGRWFPLVAAIPVEDHVEVCRLASLEEHSVRHQPPLVLRGPLDQVRATSMKAVCVVSGPFGDDGAHGAWRILEEQVDPEARWEALTLDPPPTAITGSDSTETRWWLAGRVGDRAMVWDENGPVAVPDVRLDPAYPVVSIGWLGVETLLLVSQSADGPVAHWGRGEEWSWCRLPPGRVAAAQRLGDVLWVVVDGRVSWRWLAEAGRSRVAPSPPRLRMLRD